MLKFAFSPTQNPSASQWNIGLYVGHVHFIFFVLISFALGSRRKRSFQWDMGLTFFNVKRKPKSVYLKMFFSKPVKNVFSNPVSATGIYLPPPPPHTHRLQTLEGPPPGRGPQSR